MVFYFENFIIRAITDVMEVIRQKCSQYPYLGSLATIILTTSITFFNQIIYWVGSTQDILVAGCNTSSDILALITKVIQAFFVEGISPYRYKTTGTNCRYQREHTSVMFWGVFITHIATGKLLEVHLRDNPIVTGAYAK